MILHILNGDCALRGWRANGFAGEAIVWRENYLHGTMLSSDDLSEFNRVRAAELHQLAPEKSFEAIFEELQTMHRRLLALRKSDKLVCWLDRCPFDQALKKRLLELFNIMPEKPELYIVEADVVWNEEAFRQHRNWQEYGCSV